MREPRNPFRLRASEHIESDETFVRLFSPDVLDMLRVSDLWQKHQVIRSAPGGGKTSLFRLFTPRSLLTIHALRTRDHSKDLFQRLKDLGAVGDQGPLVLGLLLSCSHSYATLDDLNVDITRKNRLLLSLLNARIVLAALQGAIMLKGLSYPDDLESIEIGSQGMDFIDLSLSLPSTGKQLYDWARSLEKRVCDALDSYAPLNDTSLPGHESLQALRIVNSEDIRIEGQPVATRTLLMLDDVHRLTSFQRRYLYDEIIAARLPVPVWVAERLEALEVDELLSLGAANGRDYGQVINIEDYWRGSASKRFERVVSNIADRRARDAKDAEIGSFAECLKDTLDGTDWQTQFRNAADLVARRVQEKVRGQQRYKAWIAEVERFNGSPREDAIAWRMLEILIERDQRKVQRTFGFELAAEELEQRDASSVRAAAELFLCQEFMIPYYYGLSRLATLASSNIEQFLWLSGDLFEESVSAVLLKRSAQLSPGRQEKILKKTVRERWASLPQRVKHGTDVFKFMEAIGKFAKWETSRPSAPYPPGVTGIAISMTERSKLNEQKRNGRDLNLTRLAEVLMSCIAQNLLEVTLNHKCKGQYWMVLNLNRMLCVHYGLPMQYGGWREKSLKELVSWLQKGFSTPSKNSQLLI